MKSVQKYTIQSETVLMKSVEMHSLDSANELIKNALFRQF